MLKDITALVIDKFTNLLWSSPDSGHSHAQVYRGFSHGFWGPVDSSIDWCEPNYVVTPYIAEFFNTLSSIPMVIWCIIGIVCTWKYALKEVRFIIAFSALGIVGLGSVAFHASLRFHGQLLDEIPMMIGNFTLLYCTLETESPRPRKLLALFVLLCAIVQVVLYIIYKWWFLFLIGYCFIVFYQLMIIWTQLNRYSKLLNRMFITCVLLYYGALGFWVIENLYCPFVQPWQFHSIWHLGAGYGVYFWILCLVGTRCEYLKKKPELTVTKPIPFAHYVRIKDNID